MKLLILALHLFPKNLLSYLTGALVRLRLPEILAKRTNEAFVRFFSIDMNEAEKPLEQYKTIEDVFTRKLKAGLRTAEETLYSSPCDGVLTTNEEIQNQEQAFEIKNISYSVPTLVQERPLSPSWISVFYLAPHNYHRVHAPFSGKVHWIKHIPGYLWPVNPSFLKYLPTLFNKNERLVFKVEVSQNSFAYIIMVGAFNVGRMTTPLAKELITNNSHAAKGFKTIALNPPTEIKKGDEIGTFMLGSTVILVFDKNALDFLGASPTKTPVGEAVKVGQSIL